MVTTPSISYSVATTADPNVFAVTTTDGNAVSATTNINRLDNYLTSYNHIIQAFIDAYQSLDITSTVTGSDNLRTCNCTDQYGNSMSMDVMVSLNNPYNDRQNMIKNFVLMYGVQDDNAFYQFCMSEIY